MKSLIVEDDRTSRLFLTKYLSRYGKCDEAVNGIEAIDLVTRALETRNYYDLVCLDIMMPKVDGLKTLKAIRDLEETLVSVGMRPARIIMTTALNDQATVQEAYRLGCDTYAWKPIEVDKFDQVLRDYDLI